MFLPWSRLVAPVVLDVTYQGLDDDRGHRGLVAFFRLDRDTPVVLRKATVLIMPVSSSLLTLLPHTAASTPLRIEYGGIERVAPRPRPPAPTVRHTFAVVPRDG